MFRQRSFGDGMLFDSLQHVYRQLLSFHLIDCEDEASEKVLKAKSLAEVCSEFRWEIRNEGGNVVNQKELESIVGEQSVKR